MGFSVLLYIILMLPKADKPVEYQVPMASIMECASAVREMTSRAPNELKDGGQLQIGCVVSVPKSENP